MNVPLFCECFVNVLRVQTSTQRSAGPLGAVEATGAVEMRPEHMRQLVEERALERARRQRDAGDSSP